MSVQRSEMECDFIKKFDMEKEKTPMQHLFEQRRISRHLAVCKNNMCKQLLDRRIHAGYQNGDGDFLHENDYLEDSERKDNR